MCNCLTRTGGWLRLYQYGFFNAVNTPFLALVIDQYHGKCRPSNPFPAPTIRKMFINPEGRGNCGRYNRTRRRELRFVAEKCRLAHVGKNAVSLNIESSRLNTQCHKVNRHRWAPAMVRQPSVMLCRPSELIPDATGEALDIFASQFFWRAWHIRQSPHSNSTQQPKFTSADAPHATQTVSRYHLAYGTRRIFLVPCCSTS